MLSSQQKIDGLGLLATKQETWHLLACYWAHKECDQVTWQSLLLFIQAKPSQESCLKKQTITRKMNNQQMTGH